MRFNNLIDGHPQGMRGQQEGRGRRPWHHEEPGDEMIAYCAYKSIVAPVIAYDPSFKAVCVAARVIRRGFVKWRLQRQRWRPTRAQPDLFGLTWTDLEKEGKLVPVAAASLSEDYGGTIVPKPCFAVCLDGYVEAAKDEVFVQTSLGMPGAVHRASLKTFRTNDFEDFEPSEGALSEVFRAHGVFTHSASW